MRPLSGCRACDERKWENQEDHVRAWEDHNRQEAYYEALFPYDEPE
jgi:hypothetical protein